MAVDGKVVIETGIDTSGFERDAGRLTNLTSRMAASLEKAAGKIKGTFSKAFGSVSNTAEKPLEKVRNAVSNMGTAINKSFQKFKTQISSAVSGAFGTDGKTNKSTKSILDMLKGIQKHAGRGRRSMLKMIGTSLLMSTVFRALNLLTKGFGESFNALTQVSGTVNADISSLTSSLKTLSNSLATAFAPILHVAAPALTTLINLISRAVTAVGMFFAALTGQKTFMKAVAVQEDYAASLGDTASAAKSARKELDNLSGLDEIKKWQTAVDSGGGGGGAGAGTLPADMFETVEVPSRFADLAAMFKEAWQNADFTEIGGIVGAKISAALNKIPWEKIKTSANKIATSTATFISGFFATPGLFDSAGKTVAEGINTALGTVGTFLKTVDWKSIGSSITTTLSSTLRNLDFGQLSSGIYAAVTGIVELFTGFLQGVDWSGVPSAIISSINEYVSGIKPEDFQGLAGAIGEALGTSFKSAIDLGKAIIDVIKKGLTGIKDYFSEYITAEMAGLDEDAGILDIGLAVIDGILKGIDDALRNVGQWIKTNIVDPFVNGFKKGFGIHSPSTVMAEQGKYIIEGLLGGINSIISKVGEVFTKIKNAITDKLSATKTVVSEIASSISNVLSSVWENAKNKAVNVFNSMKLAVVNTFNSLKTAIKTPINGIISFINSMISGLVSGINSAIRALNKIKINVPSWMPGMGGKSFGFSINTISAPRIPYLATGAVIPPNAPFAAVLGDQRNGTNLEAPESLIRQIVREESGGGDTFNVRAIANGRAIFDLIIEQGKQRRSQTGRNPFELAY